ncbi:hypothetical protein NMY22_g9284 [Coprinellus aureogranulatus]|nr:hypothetical protein NMY22_g9284 [Coprinellus aureogranulatus]
MHSLLSTLLSAIDRRVSIMNTMASGESGYEPTTCDACGGTGIILVPSTIVIDDDSDDEQGKGETRCSTPNTNYDVGNYSAEMRSFLNIRDAYTAARVAAGVSVAGAEAAPSPGDISPNQAPHPDSSTIQAPTADAPTSAPAAPTPTPAAPASSAGSTPVPMSNNGPVPLPSVLTTGFNRLGPLHPVPDPLRAVFTVPGGERYYAVTRGVRVGVFGGWLNTTAYVTGVPNAAYSKHSTIEPAYDAYCEAFKNGLMPIIRPVWTLLQTLDLHVAAIVYLRCIDQRTCIPTFLGTWWEYWKGAYGIEEPDDWDKVNDDEDGIGEQRRRVFRAIRWYALAGRQPPPTSRERLLRICRLRRDLLDCLIRYHAQGHDLSLIRPPPFFEVIFDDIIGVWSTPAHIRTIHGGSNPSNIVEFYTSAVFQIPPTLLSSPRQPHITMSYNFNTFQIPEEREQLLRVYAVSMPLAIASGQAHQHEVNFYVDWQNQFPEDRPDGMSPEEYEMAVTRRNMVSQKRLYRRNFH